MDENNVMEELLAESEKVSAPKNGDIVECEIVEVLSKKDLLVSLGVKSDGVIPKSECVLEDGESFEEKYKVGDKLKAKIIRIDHRDDSFVLSHKQTKTTSDWESVVKHYEEKTYLDVKVTKIISGGVICSYGELSGFIPLSQLADKFIESADEYYGKTLTCNIINYSEKDNKIVFSHTAFLSKEKEKRFAEIADQVELGDIIEGKVMRFARFGAFVDVGGIEGLLHISEMSWGKISDPKDMFALGETINVVVLAIDTKEHRISLGYKQTMPEPWQVIKEKYNIGDVIEGKVVQIKEYGAFVEIEKGIDGLIHISELAHNKVAHVSDVVEVGKTVKAKIFEIDEDKKRISLSLKALIKQQDKEDNPEPKPTAENDAPSVSEEQEVEPAETADAPAEETKTE